MGLLQDVTTSTSTCTLTPQGHFLFTEMRNGRIFIVGKIKGMDSNHMGKGKLVLCCGEELLRV